MDPLTHDDIQALNELLRSETVNDNLTVFNGKYYTKEEWRKFLEMEKTLPDNQGG